MQIRGQRFSLAWLAAIAAVVIVAIVLVAVWRGGGPVLGQSFSIGYADMQRALDNHPRKVPSERALQEFLQAKQAEFQQRSKAMTAAQRQELDRGLQQEFIQKRTELLSGLDKDIRTSVERVAKVQGIGIVLDRNVVLFGGTDLTDLVIKDLGGK